MSGKICAPELKKRILSGGELAILDVREEGIYFKNHLLWATNVPLSRLELLVSNLLPRQDVQVVVYDSGPKGMENPANRAQQRLQELGYSNVLVLEGGVVGWQEAGFELFSGLNVPSKTFGEYLLEERKPTEILPEQLYERLSRKENLVVLDSRPMDEYNVMSIPGAVDVPGAELVHRVFEAAPDSSTDVVVNCAGRTRSIVGAMSLVNAQIPNRVMLLKDGTMGWHLAGLELARGETDTVPEPSKENYKKAFAAASKVSERHNISHISLGKLNEWKADGTRSLYLFDVRTQQEYESGHLAGAVHVAGGQLVQTTDEYIAVKNARVVLLDDKTIRAVMTASWLRQMGHKDVHIFCGDVPSEQLEFGPAKSKVLGFTQFETIEPGELHAVMQSGEPMLLVDLSSSRNYRACHIPQAYWCIRQRLESALVLCQPIGLLVLTSEDGVLAHFAAADLLESDSRQIIRVLSGGNRNWRTSDYPVTDGFDNLLSEIDDVWDRPYDRERDQEKRMKNYLEWEVQLMDQARRDGTTDFYC